MERLICGNKRKNGILQENTPADKQIMACPWIEAVVQKSGYFWKMLIYNKKEEPRSAALLFAIQKRNARIC